PRAPPRGGRPAPAGPGRPSPAVPPAAITTLGIAPSLDRPQYGLAVRSANPATGGGDVEQDPHGPQEHDEGGRAVGDEGQRHARERHQPQDREEVERRLAEDQRR